MNKNSNGTPDYARTFIDGLQEAGVGLVSALPESLLKSVYRLCAEDSDIRYAARLENKTIHGGALHY